MSTSTAINTDSNEISEDDDKVEDAILTNSSTYESILPPVTPAILEEYQKELVLKEQAAQELSTRRRPIFNHFGVPSFLVVVLVVLSATVFVVAILAFLYYDEEQGIKPPSDAPSSAPVDYPTN